MARSNSAAGCPSTDGGQLGEAYIHGMNGLTEGVRQLRGTSVNQVPNVEHVLITAGTGSRRLASSLYRTAESVAVAPL